MQVISQQSREDTVTQLAMRMFDLEHGNLTIKKQVFTIDITTVSGYIILPDDLYRDNNFMTEVYIKLSAMCADYFHKHGKSHFRKVITLESGADHFTRVYNKNDAFALHVGTGFDRHAAKKERLIIMDTDSHAYERKHKPICRFAWFVYAYSTILGSLENYADPVIKHACQLFTIIIDDGLLNPDSSDSDSSDSDPSDPNPDSDPSDRDRKPGRLPDLLRWKHIRVLKNHMDITRFGVTKPTIAGMLLRRSSDSTLSASERMEAQMLYQQYKHYYKLPGFVLAESTSCSALQLCAVRNCAFEIIRAFGNWNMYGNCMIKPLHDIHQDVFSVKYSELQLSCDVCTNCHTVLYGDIYVLFKQRDLPTSNSEPCDPVCAVCMHSKFKDGVCSVSVGTTLYNRNMCIVRTKHPKTLQDVIAGMDLDEHTKRILLASQNILLVENLPPCVAMYFGSHDSLGSQENQENQVYLAFHGSMTALVNYLRRPNTVELWQKKQWNPIVFIANILSI